MERIVFAAALAAALALSAPVLAQGSGLAGGAAAEGGQKEGTEKEGGIDTEHIFGFTEGSDLGEAGEKELESETSGRLGRRFGTYRAIDSALLLKYSVTDDFRVAPGIAFSYLRAFNVPGIQNRESVDVQGAFIETRYRLLNRTAAPFGLTLSATPFFNRVDELTGVRASTYGTEFRILADREIVADKLYGAVNLGYGLSSTRFYATNERAEESGIEITGALAAQVLPGVFLGGEVRYARAYEGLGLDRFVGDAVFLGPTFYTKLTASSFLSATWSTQVAGRATGERGGLDLANFERHQFRVRLGYAF